MNKEEKEAMKYFYNLRATIDESNMLFDEDINVKCGKETIEKITTILNLIKKQNNKIQKAIDFINNGNNYFEDGENWQNVLKIKEILEGKE